MNKSNTPKHKGEEFGEFMTAASQFQKTQPELFEDSEGEPEEDDLISLGHPELEMKISKAEPLNFT